MDAPVLDPKLIYLQLEFAIAQRRTIVTHNRDDFKELHKQYLDSERRHYGTLSLKDAATTKL